MVVHDVQGARALGTGRIDEVSLLGAQRRRSRHAGICGDAADAQSHDHGAYAGAQDRHDSEYQHDPGKGQQDIDEAHQSVVDKPMAKTGDQAPRHSNQKEMTTTKCRRRATFWRPTPAATTYRVPGSRLRASAPTLDFD